MRAIVFSLLLVLIVGFAPVYAQVEAGIAAMQRGDHAAAYKAFLPPARSGDTKAMITVGLLFYEGKGVEQDYLKAYDWFVQAFKKRDGDAFNNIGVMFRDGLGVPRNPKISYALFLMTHLLGLGSEATQYRANRNLRGMIETMGEEEIIEALCFTEAYIDAFVLSRGALKGIPENLEPSKKRRPLRARQDLWLDSEWAQLQQMSGCP